MEIEAKRMALAGRFSTAFVRRGACGPTSAESVDMTEDLSVRSHPAEVAVASTRAEAREATFARHVREVETHIRRLPPLSGAIHQIVDQLRNVNADMGWLEKHISADPSLTTRLLKMANSAFYGTRCEVFTIPRALMILGFRTSLNVLLAASMRSAFSIAVLIPGFQPQGFTRHSVAVGTCAAALGRSLPSLKTSSDKLFVAGLLHDIGRVALAPLYNRYATEMFARAADAPPTPSLEVEIFGIDHCEAGAMVVEQWKLPLEFAEPITHHHDPLEAMAASPLTLAVRAADLFVQGEGYSMCAPLEVGSELAALFAALRTTDAEARSALSRYEAETAAFLGAVA
jgi:putative nucleotidyltransferase with HDIG domain